MPGQQPRHWWAAVTARLRSANTYAVDSALAVVVAVPVSVQFANASSGGVTPLGVLLNAGTVLPLIWRRRAPFAVAVTVAAFSLLVSVYNRPGQDLPYGALLATYTVADLGRRWQRWSFLGGLVLILGPGALLVKHYGAADFLLDLLLPLSAYLLGTLARISRERAEALEERAEQLARGRTADVARAAVEERARIARDMHDLLAHAVGEHHGGAGGGSAGGRENRSRPGGAGIRRDRRGGPATRWCSSALLGVLKEEQDAGFVRAADRRCDPRAGGPVDGTRLGWICGRGRSPASCRPMSRSPPTASCRRP